MFKATVPVHDEHLDQALRLIEAGSATEAKVQRHLGVTSSMARRVVDALVESGAVYRHAREIHRTKASFDPTLYDAALEPRILDALRIESHTALSLERRLRCDPGALRATLEIMRQQERVHGQRVSAIVVYHRS